METPIPYEHIMLTYKETSPNQGRPKLRTKRGWYNNVTEKYTVQNDRVTERVTLDPSEIIHWEYVNE